MKKYLGIFIVSLLFVFVGCSTKQKVQEQVNQTTSQALNVDTSKSIASIRSNYNVVESATSVTLYKHKTKDIYVQKISKSSVNFGVTYSQNTDKTFNRLLITDFWDSIKKSNSNVFSTVNLCFFDGGSSPTTLPFGLKVNGKILTTGYGDSKNINNRQLLLIDKNNSIGIVKYSDALFSNVSFPYAIVGVTVDSDFSSIYSVGRNMMGQNGDDFIIVNGNGTQSEIVSILNEFGITDKAKMIMFDGSGSSQLITSKNSFYGSYDFFKRKLPVVLSIIKK